MRKLLFFLIFLPAFFASCSHKNTGREAVLKTINQAFLDSTIKNSDSFYVKKYKRPDFVTAEYYVFRKDSALTQVMRDSAKQVRQVITTKKNVRTYFAQYYPNGQLIADLSFDPYGQYHGPALYYNMNGSIKSSGKYNHGLSTGTWQEFDDAGVVTKLKYDTNGVRIP